MTARAALHMVKEATSPKTLCGEDATRVSWQPADEFPNSEWFASRNLESCEECVRRSVAQKTADWIGGIAFGT